MIAGASYAEAFRFWLGIAAVSIFIFLEILATLYAITVVDREWRKLLGLPPRAPKPADEEGDGVEENGERDDP